MLYLLLTLVANAASLDLIEVGGAWGTPAATDANAVFWNPAGLAVGDGTYFSVEVAPTLATINTNRSHEYWGGEDQLKFNGVVPYIGVSSDFGHAPLGVGLSLSVPFARGGKSQNDPGPGRYHLREGGSQTIFATGAASYQIKNLISIGASLSFVHSQWDALLDTETTTQLSEALCETSADHCNNYAPTEAGDPPADYWIEDPNYATTLTFDGLKHNTFTFGTGIYVTPIDMLGISISYMHGGTLKHAGPVNMDFDCPDSEDDPMGYIGADLNGICDAKMSGDAIIEYKMPWRLNTGILLKPLKGSDKLQIEAMGAVVGWSQFTDYNITIDVDPDTLTHLDDEEDREETAETVSQVRKWARDNRTTFWIGIDAKGRLVNDMLVVGGRLTYDHTAIPENAVSPNNYDADAFIVSALIGVRPIKQLEFGLSFSHHFLTTREVTDSVFDITLDHEMAKEDRYFYTPTNGTYKGSINRLGLAVRGHLGGKKEKD